MDTRFRNPLVSALAGILLSTAAGLAQSTVTNAGPPASATPPGNVPEFGGVSQTSYTVSALEFGTFSQANTWEPVNFTPNRYLTSGLWEVPIRVPNGALIEGIQIEACDTSATDQVSVLFAAASSPAGAGGVVDSLATGVAETPGCAQFSKVLASPVTADNANVRYWFEITSAAGTADASVAAVRVFYRLQVSPAPGVATFGDVPTGHPQFKFIEALAASGITAGCGGGNYCPTNTLTRGQMAVFLSLALGLHFPN